MLDSHKVWYTGDNKSHGKGKQKGRREYENRSFEGS